MFNKGDKVVCIEEPESTVFLEYGKIYTIRSYEYTKNMSFAIVILYELPSSSFAANRFKPLVDFRKEKIDRIKQKIYDSR